MNSREVEAPEPSRAASTPRVERGKPPSSTETPLPSSPRVAERERSSSPKAKHFPTPTAVDKSLALSRELVSSQREKLKELVAQSPEYADIPPIYGELYLEHIDRMERSRLLQIDRQQQYENDAGPNMGTVAGTERLYHDYAKLKAKREQRQADAEAARRDANEFDTKTPPPTQRVEFSALRTEGRRGITKADLTEYHDSLRSAPRSPPSLSPVRPEQNVAFEKLYADYSKRLAQTLAERVQLQQEPENRVKHIPSSTPPVAFRLHDEHKQWQERQRRRHVEAAREVMALQLTPRGTQPKGKQFWERLHREGAQRKQRLFERKKNYADQVIARSRSPQSGRVGDPDYRRLQALHDLHSQRLKWLEWRSDEALAEALGSPRSKGSSKFVAADDVPRGPAVHHMLHADAAMRQERLRKRQEAAEQEKEAILQEEMKRTFGPTEVVDKACERLHGEAERRRQRLEQKRELQQNVEEMKFKANQITNAHQKIKQSLSASGFGDLAFFPTPRHTQLHALHSKNMERLALKQEQALLEEIQRLEEVSVHRRAASARGIRSEGQLMTRHEMLYQESLQRDERLKANMSNHVREEIEGLKQVSLHKHVEGKVGTAIDCSGRLYEDRLWRQDKRIEMRELAQKQRDEERVWGVGVSDDASALQASASRLYEDYFRREDALQELRELQEFEELQQMDIHSVHAKLNGIGLSSEELEACINRLHKNLYPKREIKESEAADPPLGELTIDLHALNVKPKGGKWARETTHRIPRKPKPKKKAHTEAPVVEEAHYSCASDDDGSQRKSCVRFTRGDIGGSLRDLNGRSPRRSGSLGPAAMRPQGAARESENAAMICATTTVNKAPTPTKTPRLAKAAVANGRNVSPRATPRTLCGEGSTSTNQHATSKSHTHPFVPDAARMFELVQEGARLSCVREVS